MPTQFKHQLLDQSNPSLRFIHVLPELTNGQIACEVVVKQLPATYTALSYCWGSEQHESILLKHAADGAFQPYDVRKNLHSFLKHIARSPKEVWLWIDAICIDQSNLAERNHQVQQIGTVYESAQEVLIWLGTDSMLAKGLSMCSRILMSGSDDTERQACMLDTAKRSYPFDLPELLERLQSHPFFTRLWIIQEVVLASPSGLKVMCRNLTISWLIFASIHDLLRSTVLNEWSDQPETSKISPFESLTILRHEFEMKGRHDMSDILAFTSTAECSDVRDRIYGLLSLVKNGQNFEVDYGQGVNALLCRAFTEFGFGTSPIATRTLISALKPSMGRFLQALSKQAAFYPTRPLIVRDAEAGIASKSGGYPAQPCESRAGFDMFQHYLTSDDPSIGQEWMIAASSIPTWFDPSHQHGPNARRQSWIYLENQVMPAQDLFIIFRHFSQPESYVPAFLSDLEHIRAIFSSSAFEQDLEESIPACFTLADTDQILIDPRAAPVLKAFAGSIMPRYLYLHMPPRLVGTLLSKIKHALEREFQFWTELKSRNAITTDQWLIQCDQSFQKLLKPYSSKGVTHLGGNDLYLISSLIPGTQRYLYTILGGKSKESTLTQRLVTGG